MASPAKTLHGTIAEFRDLSHNIFFYEPTTAAPHGDGEVVATSLIILCTWLGGATTRRIDKYLTKYRLLFPDTAILLIRTTILDISARSFKSLRIRLAPARDAISRVIARRNDLNDQSQGCVLLHIFSHGGCNTAIQLVLSMRESNMNLPLRGIIFDCCPGNATFEKAYHGASFSLPSNQAIQLIGRAALFPAIGTITALQTMGLMHSVRDLRRQLNDPVFDSQVRRLYLYSLADEAVRWQDVESHMAQARTQGYEVDGIKFQRSPHCALILEDDARYGAAIKDFWLGRHLSKPKGVSSTTSPKDKGATVTPSPLWSKL